MPTDASALGWRTDRLLVLGGVAIAVIAIIGIAWLAWAVLRRPPAAAPDGRGRIAPGAAIGLVVAVLALDVALFVASELDLAAGRTAHAAATDPVRIEVLAHQWAWQARYAGIDGVLATGDDPITAGELVVPVDRVVVLQLRSVDVVHSFYAPSFRVRQDVVPGRTAIVRFHPTTVGTYELACSQYCGVLHHRMAAAIRVVPAKTFVAWEHAHSADAARITAEHARAAGDVPDPRAWGWPWAVR